MLSSKMFHIFNDFKNVYDKGEEGGINEFYGYCEILRFKGVKE